MAAQIKPKITDTDLLALGGDVRAEVYDGEIVIDETVYTLAYSLCISLLRAYLGVYVSTHRLGWVGDMVVFKLDETIEQGIKTAYTPITSYVSSQRLPPDANLEILPPFAPDLAVEVISESEPHTKVLRKTNDYLDHGASQVWHVIPSLRQVHVFTPASRAGAILTDADALSGGDLLPGFAIPVRAIFDLNDAAVHTQTLRSLIP